MESSQSYESISKEAYDLWNRYQYTYDKEKKEEIYKDARGLIEKIRSFVDGGGEGRPGLKDRNRKTRESETAELGRARSGHSA